MIRTYDPDRPVLREQLEKLLNLAIRAPSAGHTQGWQFLVLDDITSRRKFWAATTDVSGEPKASTDDLVGEPTNAAGTAQRGWLDRMRTAPVLVICFSIKAAYLDRYAEPDKGWTDRDEARWPVPYWHVDTGMAAMILLLAAHDASLAGCFFGVPPERWPALFEAFEVPAGFAPVGVVSLGYPAADRKSPSLRRGRRGLDEVLTYGSFGSLGTLDTV